MSDIELFGATYNGVPGVELPKSGGGTAAFFETTWYGAIAPEFLHETTWSAKLSDASNWPLTPTTTAQNLLWETEDTQEAAANAVIDHYGNGYHESTETLDFGNYNYIWHEDAFVKYVYTTAEKSLGKVHTICNGLESIYHYGARPRVASGAIVIPTTTTYGSYGSCTSSGNMMLYRTAAGTLQLTNSSAYAVGIAAIAPLMSSTSKVKPDYFTIRTPTFSIRAHNTYMPVATYNSLIADSTILHFRCRLYRVPAEYGIYTKLNSRLLGMIQSMAFPTELI